MERFAPDIPGQLIPSDILEAQDIRRSTQVMSRFLALVALLVFCSGAFACSCHRSTGPQRYAEASFVFVGRVVAASLSPNPGLDEVLGREIVRATIATTDIYKGKVSGQYTVIGGTDYRNPVCTRALLVGAEYVFTLGADMVASSCNTWHIDDTDIQESLKTFRRLKAQQK